MQNEVSKGPKKGPRDFCFQKLERRHGQTDSGTGAIIGCEGPINITQTKTFVIKKVNTVVGGYLVRGIVYVILVVQNIFQKSHNFISRILVKFRSFQITTV